jgi:heme-degrading monooxygenase HmoA
MERNDAVLGPESGLQSKQSSIFSSFSGVTFIQLWRMPSADEKQEWLKAMHRSIHLLQVQPGYRSMSLHASLDGRNVIVYAQWDSKEELLAAVDRPEVEAARNEFDSQGEPEGAIYAVDSVHRSGEPSTQSMQIEPCESLITFVNIWTVED